MKAEAELQKDSTKNGKNNRIQTAEELMGVVGELLVVVGGCCSL